MTTSRLVALAGRTVRRERERAGLTQAELARAIGTSQPVLAHIERGSRAASLSMLERLFGALGSQLRLALVDELPEAIEVRHGRGGYSVRPLVDVEIADAHVAELLRRYRSRVSQSPP